MTAPARIAPAPLVEGPGWIGIMSQWLAWRVLDLPELLRPEGSPHWLWRRGRRPPKGLKAIAGIGYKSSSARARVLCERWGLPYLALEDGFLRSSSLGVEGDTPLSMVIDPIGIHYLADRPSLLENLLLDAGRLDTADLATADALIELMRASGIGKYNNAPDLPADDDLGRQRPLVLVVDQTYGDFSISGGGLSEADFVTMLDAALAENPGADVRVRIHPDCVAGYKRSCLLDAARQRGVAVESRVLSWTSLARRAARVYVGTSQAGLEALILGVPVTCFGLPFYAGWGLTDDRRHCPRRRPGLSLRQLVAAAYVRYCRYVDPLTGQTTDVMTVARQLARQKRQDTDFAGPLTVLAPAAQRPRLRAQLRSRWGRLDFAERLPERVEGRLLLDETDGPALMDEARSRGMEVWRHADTLAPGEGVLALSLQRRADADERLEWLRQGDCPSALLDEARALQQRLAGCRPPRTPGTPPRIRVFAGTDREAAQSLLRRLRQERPEACIELAAEPRRLDHDFSDVDEVHVTDSPAGLLALLHGLPVTTHGRPFYAGWGLTRDHQAFPDRTPPCDIARLVAAALILHPRYTDARTGLPCDVWHGLRSPASAGRSTPLALRRLRNYLRNMSPPWRRP